MAQFWNAVHPTGEEYTEEQQKKQLSVFAFWNPPMSHIGLHLAKANAMGKRLEVAFACQCDPAIHLAGGTGLPFGQDEFRFAGGLRGAPVELVKAETVDIEVPATAEFIIEGVSSRFGNDDRQSFEPGRLLRRDPGIPAHRGHGDYAPQEPALVRDDGDDSAVRSQLPGADAGRRPRCWPTCRASFRRCRTWS